MMNTVTKKIKRNLSQSIMVQDDDDDNIIDNFEVMMETDDLT